MDARVQRRIQRYGWDLAADDYEPSWNAQLAGVQAGLLAAAALAPGEQVLDVACGTGLIAFQAAAAVGALGSVLGVDLSGRMVEAASRRAAGLRLPNASFARMDAERLDLPDASVDVALCSLGLMYLPDPAQALREMARVLRPGGRLVLSVWGERSRCGWAALFEIVDAEVASEVCPLFFGLGGADTLARRCREAGFAVVGQERQVSALAYADDDDACRAAFLGGPVALAWSRFAGDARERVRARYLDSLAGWRTGTGYRVPAEFVIVSARLTDEAPGSTPMARPG
jgi:ubiquinone/menaquinone biosynthesis C-methylase UbiE